MIIIKYVNLILGCLLVSISFNLFLVPNNLAATGVSGLAIILNEFLPISTISFIYISNFILIILSFLMLGIDSTKNTLLGSILVPILMTITSNITNIIDVSSIDVLIQAVVAGLIMGYGYGKVFKSGFTTGGTDIIEMIISKYLKMDLTKSMMIVEGTIVILCGIAFGLEHMIYAFIILILISTYSNRFMLGINDDKVLFINSKKIDEIRKFIIYKYHYGITILDIEGRNYHKRKMLMCAVKNGYYEEIKDAIKLIDDKAFISVIDSYETGYLNKERRKRLRKY